MNKGFTLLELMVVIAIMATLVMISVPMYEQNQLVPRRLLAQTQLLNIAAELRQKINGAGLYTTTDVTQVLATNPIPYYSVRVEKASTYGNTSGGPDPIWTSQYFIIIATPTGAQMNDGVLCINNIGHRYWGGANNNTCPMYTAVRTPDSGFDNLKWYGD